MILDQALALALTLEAVDAKEEDAPKHQNLKIVMSQVLKIVMMMTNLLLLLVDLLCRRVRVPISVIVIVAVEAEVEAEVVVVQDLEEEEE